MKQYEKDRLARLSAKEQALVVIQDKYNKEILEAEAELSEI